MNHPVGVMRRHDVRDMDKESQERTKQIAAGAGICLFLAALSSGLIIGRAWVPGLLGEWLGVMTGVITTPFFLELSFALLGLFIVLWLNHRRQKSSGDELVYLEQVEGPEDLPDHAKWAVYRNPPLPGEEPSLLDQAAGALAIGDHLLAAECLASISDDELRTDEALAIRIELARATGREALAEDLEKQLQASRDAAAPAKG